ncbi:STAS-like domain-containing protein [Limnobacter sp.]|uniref:STAS-like domain-containing protein n=1 Tax=Limnobacter sp. TaxID=2003368 RepID=UPI002FE14456
MVIEILDHVKQASTYQDGSVIFSLVKEAMSSGETVHLSFNGIVGIPTAFVNAALLPLVDMYGMAKVKQQLKIVNSTKLVNDTIRHRFNFVANVSKTA